MCIKFPFFYVYIGNWRLQKYLNYTHCRPITGGSAVLTWKLEERTRIIGTQTHLLSSLNSIFLVSWSRGVYRKQWSWVWLGSEITVLKIESECWLLIFLLEPVMSVGGPTGRQATGAGQGLLWILKLELGGSRAETHSPYVQLTSVA